MVRIKKSSMLEEACILKSIRSGRLYCFRYGVRSEVQQYTVIELYE